MAENTDENFARNWYGRYRSAMPVAGLPGAKRCYSEYGTPRKPTPPPAISLNGLARQAPCPTQIRPSLAAHPSSALELKYAAQLCGGELQ